MGREAWSMWRYVWLRIRIVQGEFVGGGRDGAQTHRIGTGMELNHWSSTRESDGVLSSHESLGENEEWI